MDNQPLLQRHLQCTAQSTAQSALVAASMLLLFLWSAAWLFDIAEPVVRATSVVIVIIAFLAVGVRLARRGARSMETGSATAGKPASHHHERAVLPDSSLHALSAPEVHGKRWSVEVFANMDAQRFAAVCETWFAWAGFEASQESHRTPDGVDIWLHGRQITGPVAIVRCQYALNKPVGLQDLCAFQGIVASCKGAHGTFTTTSTYTPEALQFADDNGIEVVDGRGLIRRILTRTRQSQQALLQVAYHGR